MKMKTKISGKTLLIKHFKMSNFYFLPQYTHICFINMSLKKLYIFICNLNVFITLVQ